MADRQLIDPLKRTITLHDHTWYGHIVKRHPEMAQRRRAVEQAIRTPQHIVFSTSDAACRLYFGATDKAGIMIVAVADVVAGALRTAYRTARLKGATEWSRPTH